MKKSPKILIIMFFILAITIFPSLNVNAASYSNYTYDYWGNPVPAPAAYLPVSVINDTATGVARMKDPSDLFVDKTGKIYIVDSGNSRILVFDKDYKLVSSISQFENEGETDVFLNPQGIYVTSSGNIYIADTGKARIVALDSNAKLLRIIGAPQSDLFEASFEYKPQKIAVDDSGRMYIIALNVNKGLIELDVDGGFVGFFGANKVIPNMVDYMWKMISTDAIRAKLPDFVPTEYSNITLDEEGFIYVTTSKLDSNKVLAAVGSRSKDDNVALIRKLNPGEDDVLRRHGVFPPVGDVSMSGGGAYGGMSLLTDISVEESGIYSVLDSKHGRVFTYDNDGNLMYMFGFIGNSLGNFRTPNSLATTSEGDILVLDGQLNSLTVFKITEYGSLLKEAVTLHHQGKYFESAESWEKVLKLNANCDLAYIGMGKAMMRQDKYKEAMDYFHAANNRDYYTRAFKLYRKEFIEDNINYFLIILMVLIAIIWVLYKLRKRRQRKGVEIK